ncbi:transglycosylase domain-containing protein [Chengkuizengella axinellae]|uniref:PBP1A family penicillin-binding protein n=1 Tax=Chengkuizengella axinellae TaxID=3064388 RepID=A0ABT9IYU4_9BACL|nr:PBP1A family penicillin-binding protein [Chengkuizengella sp. 2205SS18-9]MDP5273974.1 PBP1A family penicillin-binding protein [Chengkuizengella sp. 2205SS18-9]
MNKKPSSDETTNQKETNHNEQETLIHSEINNKQTSNKKPLKKFLKWTLGFFILFVVLIFAGYMMVILNGEKLLKENLEKMDMLEASIIYDHNGNEVRKLYKENREIVNMDEIPELMVDAFIATEDKRFNEHGGVDLWAIGRALYKDLVSGEIVEGGSTITQQLAKNMFLSSEKTVFRKVQEASIAIALENQYSKDEIIAMYLNQIYFGQGNVYGVKAASEIYFGKEDLNDLELWEIATLAAIPKAPSYYNPIDDSEKSKERRAIVLQLMYEQNLIAKSEMSEASKVDYKPISVEKQSYVSFIDYVILEAADKTGLTEDELREGGYRIYTTLDTNVQQVLEKTFSEDQWFPESGPEQQVQASMVIMDHNTGELKGMIGGRDTVQKGLNRALIPRQPGSSFKPIAVYAPALETGSWQPYSNLKDEPIKFGDYEPKNYYEHQYLGQVSMVKAIEDSINIPAVWLLNEIGIQTSLDFINNIGIELDENDRNLSIALGGLTTGVTPLDMTEAYSSFANNGTWTEATSIRKVINDLGETIYLAEPLTKEVMSEQNAYYMTKMMEEVVLEGTGYKAQMNRSVAGKTGSTQVGLPEVTDPKATRDLWFVGYTPEWTAAVWMGFDKTDTQHYLTVTSSYPAQLFSQVMTQSLADVPSSSFVKPEGVEELVQPPTSVDDLTILYDERNRAVELTWSPVEGNDNFYLVYKKEDKDKNYELVFTTFEPYVIDIAIKEKKKYQYYVITYNNKYELYSRKSNTVNIEIPKEKKNDVRFEDLFPFFR